MLRCFQHTDSSWFLGLPFELVPKLVNCFPQIFPPERLLQQMHPGYHIHRVHVEFHVHTINQIVTQLQEQNGGIFTRKWIALPRITLILSGYYPVEGNHKHSVKPHSSKPKIINLSSTFLLTTRLVLLATGKLIGWGKATKAQTFYQTLHSVLSACNMHIPYLLFLVVKCYCLGLLWILMGLSTFSVTMWQPSPLLLRLISLHPTFQGLLLKWVMFWGVYLNIRTVEARFSHIPCKLFFTLRILGNKKFINHNVSHLASHRLHVTQLWMVQCNKIFYPVITILIVSGNYTAVARLHFVHAQSPVCTVYYSYLVSSFKMQKLEAEKLHAWVEIARMKLATSKLCF